ncbi:MAG TPA: hypothetical protein VFR32_05030, partial [Gaiellaceae bacterium]|nr:hypothetical protein [Gaiellaceae bacterium]
RGGRLLVVVQAASNVPPDRRLKPDPFRGPAPFRSTARTSPRMSPEIGGRRSCPVWHGIERLTFRCSTDAQTVRKTCNKRAREDSNL